MLSSVCVWGVGVLGDIFWKQVDRCDLAGCQERSGQNGGRQGGIGVSEWSLTMSGFVF